MSHSFYVYENWTVSPKKAIVHLGACSFCNSGRGVHQRASGRNGRWHGPYSSLLNEADQAAAATGRERREHCRFCLGKPANRRRTIQAGND